MVTAGFANQTRSETAQHSYFHKESGSGDPKQGRNQFVGGARVYYNLLFAYVI